MDRIGPYSVIRASYAGNGRRRMRAPVRRRRGRGFFDSIKRVLSSIGNFVKDNRLISRGLSLIPHPYARVGSTVASSLGLGRRRRRPVRRRRGGNLKTVLKKAHDFVRTNRLVSRGLQHFGYKKLSAAARALGYGKRMRRRRRYRRRY